MTFGNVCCLTVYSCFVGLFITNSVAGRNSAKKIQVYKAIRLLRSYSSPVYCIEQGSQGYASIVSIAFLLHRCIFALALLEVVGPNIFRHAQSPWQANVFDIFDFF